MSKSRAAIIGGSIGGLATACLLAKKGYAVQLFEKNERVGGVANRFEAEGFSFDMGPSWYLMPDVFQNFFALLGERVEDHLDLVKLSPSYRIFSRTAAASRWICSRTWRATSLRLSDLNPAPASN